MSEAPMSEAPVPLAPAQGVSRATFNLLPVYIGAFCVLWSFAFVVGKVGVMDCPPLLLLSGRFLAAGLLILGFTALRREAWSLSWREIGVFAILGVANNALYLGFAYVGLQSISAGRRRLDRERQSGLHRSIGGDLPRRSADMAKTRRPFPWRDRRRLHRRPSSFGGYRQPARYFVHACVARLDRRRDDPVQALRTQGQFMDRQRHPKSVGRPSARACRAQRLQPWRHRAQRAAHRRFRLPRAVRIHIGVFSYGSTCSRSAARRLRVRFTF